MASKIGDSAGSRRLARALRNGSDALDRAQRDFRREIDRSDNRGRFHLAQLAFRSAQDLRGNLVERQMDTAASAISEHAKWVEDTEHELKDLERRIRNWAAANPAPTEQVADVVGAVVSAKSGPDASLITYWPPHLSFEWRDLASRLRAHGAWF